MSLETAIASTLDTGDFRVRSFEHGGATYWIKRPESLSLRMRLQKGDAARAFRHERNALTDLARLGVPVPTIVAEGADYIVMTSGGPSLNTLLTQRWLTSEARVDAFRAAGRALASMHNKGLCHGRPSLKDILWDGQAVTFIDFERSSVSRTTDRGPAMDLLFFVHAGIRAGRGMTDEMAGAIDAYQTDDARGTWAAAQRIAAHWTWVTGLSRLLTLRRSERSRDWRAIPQTLALFRDTS
jgi:tRNA A-37 threonylcarbamoyl transferase component Bud32